MTKLEEIQKKIEELKLYREYIIKFKEEYQKENNKEIKINKV